MKLVVSEQSDQAVVKMPPKKDVKNQNLVEAVVQLQLNGVSHLDTSTIELAGSKEPSSTAPSPPSTPANGPVEDEFEDPLCTAKTAHRITFQDVTTASFMIKGGVEYTPCPVSEQNDGMKEDSTYVKYV